MSVEPSSHSEACVMFCFGQRIVFRTLVQDLVTVVLSFFFVVLCSALRNH